MKTKRKIKDKIFDISTYASATLTAIILGAIIIFIFSKGINKISFNFIFGKNAKDNYIVETSNNLTTTFNNPKNYENFSTKYGIAFEEGKDYNNESVIEIIYVDKDSPLKNMKSIYSDNFVSLSKKFYFDTYIELVNELNEEVIVFAYEGAKEVALALDNSAAIKEWLIYENGGGIIGSIITTLLLVLLTMLIGFPIGILTALYLHELAPNNKLFNSLRVLIDMLTGVPSIISGLIGAALLIPLSQKILINNEVIGGNILAGALTLSIMVLPVVIKATETALDNVPKDYKQASLALGATDIQTTFKVILPSALPGILTAALLTIGRVIGESAALIYVIGTVINDQISIGGKGTSLAVHIWTVMAGESPNVEAASGIAIIILLIVLGLNLLVKFSSNKLSRKYGG